MSVFELDADSLSWFGLGNIWPSFGSKAASERKGSADEKDSSKKTSFSEEKQSSSESKPLHWSTSSNDSKQRSLENFTLILDHLESFLLTLCLQLQPIQGIKLRITFVYIDS